MNVLLPAAVTATTTSAPSPSPSFENQTGGKTTGAGSLAFLVVIGLIVLSIALFWAMNRSLRRVRRNLGGDQLPRPRTQRRRPFPVREDDEQPGPNT